MGVVEDEVHVVFECPAYQIARLGFHALFRSEMIQCVSSGQEALALIDTDMMMRRFFGQEHQSQVASFINCCMRTRTMLLSSAV